MAKCEFTMLFCPRLCKDDKNEIKYFMRKDRDKHLKRECPFRDYKCEHCGMKGMYEDITQVHDKTCKKKIVPCPNLACPETIQRRMTKRHLEECDYSEIPCKYRKIGCGVKMMRKDMPKHEDDEDKLHLHKALDKVIELTTFKDSVVENLTTLREDGSWTFKMEEFQFMKDNERSSSSSFYSSPNGYHMQVKVYANGVGDGKGTHVSVCVHMLEGKHDAKLKWPFTGSVSIQLLNQLKDKNHYEKTLYLKKASGIGKKKKYIPHGELAYDMLMNTQFLKKNTLYFRVSVSVDVDMPDNKPWLECMEWN